MTELTFDVSAPPVAGYYLLTGGSDGIYLFFKFSPRPGFSVVKVTHGISTLWESEDTLISVTIHRLGNLPVGLAIQLSDSALYFCYENFFWHPIGEEVYREKLRLDIHRCNFGKFGLDLSNVDTQDVTTVPVHDGTFLTTLFKPKRGNILISVRDGSQTLWEAKGGEKVIYAAVDHEKSHAHLTLLNSYGSSELCFEKRSGTWEAVEDIPGKFKILTH